MLAAIKSTFSWLTIGATSKRASPSAPCAISRAWLRTKIGRANGAISRRGKQAAGIAFAVSAVVGLVFAPMPWALAPVAAGVIGGLWIWRRPEA